jgi:hypothetical protein
MVFWNLDKKNIETSDIVNHSLFNEPNDTNSFIDNPRIRFFSGFSPTLMRVFSDTKTMSAFDTICHILDDERYSWLDQHV